MVKLHLFISGFKDSLFLWLSHAVQKRGKFFELNFAAKLQPQRRHGHGQAVAITWWELLLRPLETQRGQIWKDATLTTLPRYLRMSIPIVAITPLPTTTTCITIIIITSTQRMLRPLTRRTHMAMFPPSITPPSTLLLGMGKCIEVLPLNFIVPCNKISTFVCGSYADDAKDCHESLFVGIHFYVRYTKHFTFAIV